MNHDNPTVISPVAAGLRRLKRDERVQRGDFVQDENREFKLWEGLNGFRANAFVKHIYRLREPLAAKAKKSS